MRLKEVIWYRSESIIGLLSVFKSPYILLIFYYGCIKSHLRRSGHCKTLFALQNRPFWSICAAPYLAHCKPKFIMKKLNRYFTLSRVPKWCGKLLALFQPAVTQCWLRDLNQRWETCVWYESLKTNQISNTIWAINRWSDQYFLPERVVLSPRQEYKVTVNKVGARQATALIQFRT